jgi:hypothetical protein
VRGRERNSLIFCNSLRKKWEKEVYRILQTGSEERNYVVEIGSEGG